MAIALTEGVTRGAGLAIVAVLLTGACGSDGRTDAERTEVVTWLVQHDETPTKAECIADELEAYRVTDFDALAEVSEGDSFDEEFKADVDAALEVCEA